MWIRSSIVVGIGLMFAVAARAQQPNACLDVILPGGQCAADIGAAVATCCPCDGQGNHGSYVSCVAHAANALRKAGCLDQTAKTSIKRCAARSTCGKPAGSVTCCLSKPGVCDNGFCVKTEPPLPCTTDAECPVITRCSIKSSSDICMSLGGTPGTGSCCNACAAP